MKQVVGQEQIAVGDVVRMMRSFQCMSEALINRLDRDEARVWHPLRFHCALRLVLVAFTVNLRRSNFLSSLVPRMAQLLEAWLENMVMCFSLHDYTSNMKVCMVVFQLKGSALLWWKTLLPQLNMAIEDVSWELFEERF
jgi:hypothetical protein